MNISKTLAVAISCAALVACGGGGGEDNAANADANMTDMNAGMTDMNMDMNAGMDANMTINGADGMNATENAVANDLTTNEPDANLANGT
jgi:hypothetical protein